MLLQPCLRAQSSAAASNCAPAPRLLCPSATTKPFNSARTSTSSSGLLLTCSQPMTPSFDDSATNTACCDNGLIPRNLSRTCEGLAGYPSCPLSSAIRGASPKFAPRIFNSFSLPPGVIFFTPPSAAAAPARHRFLIPAAHLPRSIAPRLNPVCEFFPPGESFPGSGGYFSFRYFLKPSSPLSLQNFSHHGLPEGPGAAAAETLHPLRSYRDRRDRLSAQTPPAW